MTGDQLASFQTQLLDWYDRHKRDLPWRGSGLSPYHALVSEAMLQQTQVAAVIDYFNRFVAELPTVQDLADAPEQTVLRLWQGLGYYRRARHLHAAAKTVVDDFDGEVPSTVDELLRLPGVGRYSAGAIASIAFDVPAPILDGNVMRVLCRIESIKSDPRETKTQKRLWSLAEQVVPRERAGDFNSGLMELGALCCTPRTPQCLICPVRDHCKAQADGLQDEIPPVKKKVATPTVRRTVWRIENDRGEFLVEQRPATGRWAGMWQFITREHDDPPVTVSDIHELGEVRHGLTHRKYVFTVRGGRSQEDAPKGMRWASRTELEKLPMSKPQLKIRAMGRK
ncbi:MAG: A/G-specific adenine glycosylase [Planctomycetota bacterium]